MTIKIDDKKCLACEICTTICPEIFISAENGVVDVRLGDVPDDLLDICYHAEECCPSQAITIHSPDLWDDAKVDSDRPNTG
jgi:ferredoxin